MNQGSDNLIPAVCVLTNSYALQTGQLFIRSVQLRDCFVPRNDARIWD
jgi:hypothetical protein